MKFRHSTGGMVDKVEMQMTPMIDVVFQLLSFFIMTLKFTAIEGDFNVKMPIAAISQGQPPEVQLPPIKIRLTADAEGNLTSIRINDKGLPSFEALRDYIISFVGDDRGPGSIAANAEVELDCDPQLKYDNVMKAITAVSGYITEDRRVGKLIEKIKFSPPKAPGR